MFRTWFAPRRGARGSSAPAAPRARLRLTPLDDRTLPSTSYLTTNLVSDQPGVAAVTDPHLVNAWGISFSPTSPFWVSSNGADLADLYRGDVGTTPLQKVPLEVPIQGGAPTGQVFNSTTDFPVSNGAVSRPSVFIFASEAGMVTGWNPAVSPSAKPGYTAPDEAVYKGIALAQDGGHNFLYLADFHNNKIDVLDGNFHLTHLGGSFTDPGMHKGFAPFNVAAIGGKLYVSYAKQDADAHDDVAGPANGFVDVFDTDGNFQQRLITRGHLNSPWAMVQAPATFGDLGGDLLVGNFGDGRINAYNPTTGDFVATMTSAPGHPVVIDGLWGMTFGNGTSAGDRNTLYFAAGPDDEAHGLFGKITANPGKSDGGGGGGAGGGASVAGSSLVSNTTTTTVTAPAAPSSPAPATGGQLTTQADPGPAPASFNSQSGGEVAVSTGIAPPVATPPADDPLDTV